MKLRAFAVAGAMTALMGTSAMACGPDGQSIRILASDFPAIHAVAGTAEANCGSAASEFTRNHTTEARDIMNAALTPDPAEYTSVIVANSTLTQLMNDGLVRPLNDLVEAYGENIPQNLLITIDGNVMAIAFMANSQHLFARTDVLAEAGRRWHPQHLRRDAGGRRGDPRRGHHGASDRGQHAGRLEHRRDLQHDLSGPWR